jgi:hypothetical protein
MSVITSQFSAAAITTNDITFIAVIPNGNIYVVGGSFQIFVYSSTGTYLNTITTFDYIAHFTIDYSNNLVYCAGVSSFFVVNIATNTVTSTYSSVWLNGIAYSSDGYVYGTTNTGYIIQKINPANGTQSTIFTSSNGNIISDSYGTFANCVLDNNEYLYCVTRGVGYVYKFARTGSLIGLFSMVNVATHGITFDPTNKIFYVTSTDTNELYTINKYGQKTLYSSLNGSSFGTFYDKISKKVYATSRPKTVYTLTLYVPPNNHYNINNSNLLYYYPLDTDLLNYASGTGVNDASYTTSITTATTILNSGSLDLNGTTNMFKLPGHSYQAGGITICMWMKSKTLTPNWYHLFDFGNGQGVDNILFGFTGSDVGNLKGYYHMFNGGSEVFRSYISYGITDLNWHHYCVTIAPNGAWTVYVDGINQNVNNVGYPSTVTRATCYIGNSFWEDPRMVAYINQILVFNRTLTSTEVSYLSNSPVGVQFSSMSSQEYNDSYTTTPSSLTYGSPFQLIYSSPNYVLNQSYVLKYGSNTIDTQTYTGVLVNTLPSIIFNATVPDTYSATLQIYDSSGIEFGGSMNLTFTYPCFLEGSKILRLNIDIDEEEYIAVEKLKPGDIIKTSTCGYKSIAFIGKSKLERPADDPNKKNRLYVFNKKNCKGVFKDLCITGEHCTLHKTLTPEKRKQVREYMGDDYITETFHRVPACLDERAEPYIGDGPVTIWHFALEHNNLYNNYAVYANGLLVETCSIDFLLNKSSMELV